MIPKVTKKKASLYVAVIDASGGCLEGFQRLLSKLPANIDHVAYIITQPRSMSCKNVIANTLIKNTRLNVTEARNGITVRPGSIYLVPKDKHPIIRNRKLFLYGTDDSLMGKQPAEQLVISVDKEQQAEGFGLFFPGHDAAITELIKVKEEQKMKEALEQRQRLFSSIAKNFPDGIIGVLDKDFHYVFAGGTEIKKMGTTPEQLIGDNIFDHFSEKSNGEALPFLEKAFAGEEVFFEIEMKNNVYAINAVPLFQNANEPEQILVVLHNVTKRKIAEHDLYEALKKEKELSELKTRFVSMASHEFRTPLSTILSSAYLIGKYPATEDQPKREKHLHRLISSVTMLNDILNDFLSLGKIEEGHIQVRPLMFNLRDWVNEIISYMESSLQKQQKIHYTHTGEPVINTDPSLLKHIVMNLLSNASKFSHEGSRIEIRTKVTKGQLTLFIKDHGIGIAKEDQTHLMERFFRGANATNIQGTGLGLHIVSRYTELLNGTIKWESEIDKGTEFMITFQLKKE